MKTYIADREKHGRSVKVQTGSDFYWLDPRPSQKKRNHSPDGFEWGYGGSGPAQLALAILMDYGDPGAEAHYQQFKFGLIGGLPKEGWAIEERDVAEFLRNIPATECRSPWCPTHNPEGAEELRKIEEGA